LKPSLAERVDLKFPAPAQTKSQPTTQEYSQLQQTLDTLNQEYQRLQKQLQDQQAQLWQEYQRSTVQALESLLLQWPTAAYAARQHPEAPAMKILPLLRPLETLLDVWGIVLIGEVGAEIAFDPQWHQLMPGGESTATKGDKVTVRYVGYRQGETLLYRAKVSPLSPAIPK
jgi:molecular chaperone GrpE (heat shock protein)